MTIFSTNRFNRRTRRWLALGLSLCCLLCQAERCAGQSLDERQRHVQSLSANEKKELKRRRDRFDQLPQQEQDRLRQLHEHIANHEDAGRLRTILDRYADWLKTVSASQRADLQKLPPKERIERIRETKRRSEFETFGRFTSQPLTPEDARCVFSWLDDEFVADEQERLEAMLDEHDRRWLRMIKDESHRRAMMLKKLYRRDPDILGEPTAAQIAELVKQLSPEARKKFQAQPDAEQKDKLVQQWIHAALMSRHAPPPVSEQELQEFFASLSPERREDLEQLPRDRMYRELSRMYFFRQAARHGMGGPPRDGANRRFGPRNGRRGNGDFEWGRGGRERRPPRPDGERRPDSRADKPSGPDATQE